MGLLEHLYTHTQASLCDVIELTFVSDSGLCCCDHCFHLSVAAVDVDTIVKERDFKTLETNLVNLTFCNVDLEVGFCMPLVVLFTLKDLQASTTCIGHQTLSY